MSFIKKKERESHMDTGHTTHAAIRTQSVTESYNFMSYRFSGQYKRKSHMTV